MVTTTTTGWTCKALVPRGDVRVTCKKPNHSNAVVCAECGAPKNHNPNSESSNLDTSNKKDKNMSTETVKPATKQNTVTHVNPANVAPKKADAVPTKAVAPNVETKSTAAEVAAKPAASPDPTNPDSYKGLPRLKFYSTQPGKEEYCARVLPIFVDKYGAPKDPWGNTMQLRTGDSVVPKKVQKLEQKEAEKAKLALMTNEEKLAYAKAKREAASAAKAEKVRAQKMALMAELKAELEAQGLVVKASGTTVTA